MENEKITTHVYLVKLILLSMVNSTWKGWLSTAPLVPPDQDHGHALCISVFYYLSMVMNRVVPYCPSGPTWSRPRSCTLYFCILLSMVMNRLAPLVPPDQDISHALCISVFYYLWSWKGWPLTASLVPPHQDLSHALCTQAQEGEQSWPLLEFFFVTWNKILTVDDLFLHVHRTCFKSFKLFEKSFPNFLRPIYLFCCMQTQMSLIWLV